MGITDLDEVLKLFSNLEPEQKVQLLRKLASHLKDNKDPSHPLFKAGTFVGIGSNWIVESEKK